MKMGESNQANILFCFREKYKSGTKQQYFHLLWGYLLPAVYWIITMQKEEKGKSGASYYFLSCGPVMDKITNEFIQLIDIKAFIIQSKEDIPGNSIKEIFTERWDNLFVNLTFIYNYNIIRLLSQVIIELVQFGQILDLFHTKELTRKINLVKKFLEEKIIAKYPQEINKFNSKPFYVLKRTSQPVFYDPKLGNAEKPTYGTGKRSFMEIDEAVEILRQKCKIDIETYEPGNDTFIGQFIHFQNCKGIITIRGAELANIAWMNTGTRVIVFDNFGDRTSSPVKALARICKIDFMEQKIKKSNFPSLKAYVPLLERILKNEKT